ncbi:putative BET2-geranylgeranyltransferase type II beta subunit [Violaceomyces palustris]|uniref:BET2-geranylgeranyltransferase type II beta subunit n=1 Tax=Violaceomyces palustris TaxID=1673888 RepID=A0ACD0NPB0_9BASI|nr:putative BET2-geranylgeranyltransferase type II beta subunit [Violaceomyces palustris]
MQPTDHETELLIPLHVSYIKALDTKVDSLAYHLTTHLRMNGVYWGLTALEIMGEPQVLDKDQLVRFVLSCWDDQNGGFGSFPNHDSHILSTLSAIQILAMKDSLHVLEERGMKQTLVSFILSLQTPSGSFQGDKWGEEDTRFLYCSVSALALLGELDKLDRKRTVDHILRCGNFDGGFGRREGAESHSGQVFVCVAALSILESLDKVDVDKLGWWLCERQLDNGGLNGRPQKLEDVCYSWWVLSSLSMIKRLDWINAEKLSAFILSAQDPEGGGIADRPDNVTDVFHTNFGVAGLSLLGYRGLKQVDPTYCLPSEVVQKLGIERDYQRKR